MESLKADEVDWAIQNGMIPVGNTERIETPDILQLFTPGFPKVVVNCVLRSIFTDESAESEILRLKGFYQSRSVPVWWLVGPSSRPADLSTRLKAHGWVTDFHALGLGIEVSQSTQPLPPEIKIHLVDESNISNYWAVIGMSESDSLKEWNRRMFQGDFGKIKLYYATVNGELAGAAGFVILNSRIAYLMNAYTIPLYRSKGVYSALLAYRLNRLHNLGILYAATLAMTDSSSPLCIRLGFKAYEKYEMLITK